MTERARLDSWKQIADYLKRDVRTVTRWERERGLPVHRVPGGKGRSVFAYRDQIDVWLASMPARGGIEAWPAPAAPVSRRRALLLAAVGGLSTAVVGTSLWLLWPAPPIGGLAFREQQVVAINPQGGELWAHNFPHRIERAEERRRLHLADVDGDGRHEAIAAVTLTTPFVDKADTLNLFGTDGRLRWQRTLRDQLRFEAGEYGPPWLFVDLTVYRTPGETRIAWALRHHVWWPAILLVVDGAGRERSRFIHPGWIDSGLGRPAAPARRGAQQRSRCGNVCGLGCARSVGVVSRSRGPRVSLPRLPLKPAGVVLPAAAW